jgi:hypothetical protein
MNTKHIYGLFIRVLLYQEEGEVCAHALELDLLGYGKTEDQAVAELFEAIQCQISFAQTKNDDSILRFPAPQEFFDRWDAAHAAALRNLVFPDKCETFAIKATCVTLEIPPGAAKARFKVMDLACA